MGQRTQIIIVSDLVYHTKKKSIDKRIVTVHHDQWGYGRPVLMDLVAMYQKIDTDALIIPSDYYYAGEASGIDNYTEAARKAYALRALPCHSYNDIEHPAVELTGNITKENRGLCAIDIASYLLDGDNNNGGALLWDVRVVNEHGHDKHITRYGCCFGPEDVEENPCGYFVPGLLYMQKESSEEITEQYTPVWKAAEKAFNMRLLNETDTLETLIKKED